MCHSENAFWRSLGYHLLLDEQADMIFESIDELAERLRKIGSTTLRSISHVSQLQTIEDDNDDFVAPGDMIRRLLDDNRKVAKAQRDALKIADDHDDAPTNDLLQQILNETERRIWFLFEISQGEANTI